VERDPDLLALRVGKTHHALELGRTYILGSGPTCDLQIEGAEDRHAQIEVTRDELTLTDLGSSTGVLHNEKRIQTAVLRPGDRIAVAGELMVIIIDDGSAALLPIPELRNKAIDRRLAKVRLAAAAIRRSQGVTFSDLMAAELRRTPWIALSIAFHLLLLLLIWILAIKEPARKHGHAIVNLDVVFNNPKGLKQPEPLEVISEVDHEEEVTEEIILDLVAAPVESTDILPTEQPTLSENPTLAKRNSRTPKAKAGSSSGQLEDGLSGNFRKTVAQLQDTGLEIAFVFDSTGSMTRTILDTKSTIVQMLDVLRSILPDARVGLVTFRDRGDEDYLVKQVPLDIDYWRASNFMQFVWAQGGGDIPEAVDAGLNAAYSLKWSPKARRVVVLAGDAPAHKRRLKQLLSETRRFASNGRSFVHTLITNPKTSGESTKSQFHRIAKVGKGTCEHIGNHVRVLQRVLTLAFGREFSNDIQSVIETVQQERERVDAMSLSLVRQGGRLLNLRLQQKPLPTALWNAIVRRPRQDVAKCLIDLLIDSKTPTHARHAAAAALQRIFEMPTPPIDMQSNRLHKDFTVTRLRKMSRRLPE
jgi:hypothetical protein